MHELVWVAQGHVITWEIVSHNPDIHEVEIQFDNPMDTSRDYGGNETLRLSAAQREAANSGRRHFFRRGDGPKSEPSAAAQVSLVFAQDPQEATEPQVGRGMLWGVAPMTPHDSERYKYTVYAYDSQGSEVVNKDPEVISQRPGGGTPVTPGEN